MKISATRLIGICLASALSGMLGLQVASAQQIPAQVQSPPQPQPQAEEPPVTGQPTMPPINRGQLPDNPNPSSSSKAVQTLPPSPPAAAQTVAPPQPTGTAAAEVARPAGVAVSSPAGAAIAPPRQRQVRSFLIKVGVIAGAGVALGTVAALSAASSSRVPNTGGSH
jgi:hypothetical protein